MLVLGRKREETIAIDGGRITIKVIAIKGDQVRLGITAPKDVPINRGEVQAAIDRERIEAGDIVSVPVDGAIVTMRVTYVDDEVVIGLWERRPGEYMALRTLRTGVRLVAKGGESR